ncbi:MAG: glycosyltransferase [Candidatus Omnitrophica bacterium]|nr:glycosyltransferase [Candidatus Omnitrophota bacterium]
MDFPRVAVIIPFKGSSPYLQSCLDSILGLDYPNFEAIAVDDGLGQEAKKKLTGYKDKVKVLNSFNKGPSFARNLAAGSTDAEFLAFTDSDCLVDKNWLRELLRGFEEYPGAVACGGVQKLSSEASEFEEKVFRFMKKAGFIIDYMRRAKDEYIIEVDHNASCNVMYRKEPFLKEKGFAKDFWPGEDVELDYRLKKNKMSIIFNPRAIVYHYKPKDSASFVKMMHRYGKAQGVLVRRYGPFRKVQVVGLLGLAFLFLGSFKAVFMLLFLVLATCVSLIYLRDFSLFKLLVLTGLAWELGFITGIISNKTN